MQATQPTTSTAPPEVDEQQPQGATLTQAHAVAGCIIGQLTTLPRDIDMKREITGEYSVHIFWGSDVSGVRALASWQGASWELVPSDTSLAVYAETRLRVDGVEVWAWTLLTREEAVAAEQLLAADRTHPTATPGPAPEAEPAALPVPLGESVVAHVPVVQASDSPDTIVFAPVPAPAAGGEQ
ncbi:hypothetical protein [Streptomyces neyagawaensis]|uniref:hypothetical protein n=1 Tax=Streptomyces neyagawaensis TaxID=42238 RepID=UPI000AF46558|nr:hypothetical protein [Streptomyces neyagawaensis]MCL6733338.1 hypothetical protein [Streptomyces neyagawaensis]MDE1685142.1 hypothetical protein [Streptomyces neyagawaensis]